VAVSEVRGIGTADARVTPRSPDDLREELAETLADVDDAFLAAYLDGSATPARCDAEFVAQVRRGRVCPVLFGSARTGVGVSDLVQAVERFLPVGAGTDDGPLSGTIFKVERGTSGEKVAYVRLWSGTMRPRDRVVFHRPGPGSGSVEQAGKVTAMRVYGRGDGTRLGAGGIAQVWGLKDVLIGDRIGVPAAETDRPSLARPGLESEVRAVRPDHRTRLFAGLTALAEQDPFINVRRGDDGHAITVSLYGEVQKEVIKATLLEQFGVEAEFGDTRTVHIEKVTGVGAAVQAIDKRGRNDFWATIGLRVEPGPDGSGVVYRLGVEPGSLPSAFHEAIRESVFQTLRIGLHGWEVTDCVITLTHSGYASPVSTGGDFRSLTPLVLMDAVRDAGTRVHEPVDHFEAETPVGALSAVLTRLAKAGAVPREPVVRGDVCVVEGAIPTIRVQELERQLPSVMQGEGVFLSYFEGYRPVTGKPPKRSPGRLD
jgi:ribosomal protection tetracycline resistance protein